MAKDAKDAGGAKKRRWWVFPLLALAVLAGIALLYVAYVYFSYSRIPDNLPLSPSGGGIAEEVKIGVEYTAVSYNVGFGAYTPDFTFFMDGGTESWATSGESVIQCIRGAAETARSFQPDLALFQEVDLDSTRSYHIDEAELIREVFPAWDSVAAVNYHSAFLMYPPLQPHGASNSCLLTESAFPVTSALRRSLPISDGFGKLLDLDRCYSVSRIPVENGRELVVINTHLSAYGTDAVQGEAQIEKIVSEMAAEYAKGNYVICGGDFNHDFTGNSKEILNPGNIRDRSWCQPFPDDALPDELSKCDDYAESLIPSTRDTDIPYGPESFVVVLDGFLVSENVRCTYVQNIDTGFVFSDHNPVLLRFTLAEED